MPFRNYKTPKVRVPRRVSPSHIDVCDDLLASYVNDLVFGRVYVCYCSLFLIFGKRLSLSGSVCILNCPNLKWDYVCIMSCVEDKVSDTPMYAMHTHDFLEKIYRVVAAVAACLQCVRWFYCFLTKENVCVCVLPLAIALTLSGQAPFYSRIDAHEQAKAKC